MANRRSIRVGDLLRQELSDIIRNEIKDPGIDPFVTVTAVQVSDDIRYARVFISILGSDDDQPKCIEALERAAGFIRGQLGRRIRLRYIPELSFRYDHSYVHAARIAEVMKTIAPIIRKTDTSDDTSSAEDADHG